MTRGIPVPLLNKDFEENISKNLSRVLVENSGQFFHQRIAVLKINL